MARALCNHSPKWLMVHETNGGWGETFLRAFRDTPAASPGDLYFERDPISGKYASDPGWNQTHTRRGELLSALQRAMAEGGLKIQSRAALENLMQVRLDERERWDVGHGKGPHGEDVITLGIACCVMERASLPRRRVEHQPRPQLSAPLRRASKRPIRERW